MTTPLVALMLPQGLGESVMNIEKAITACGTDAVIRYRGDSPTIKDADGIPEWRLTSLIASCLIEDCGLDARMEIYYTKILEKLGVTGNDIDGEFGGKRADIVIYEEGKPAAIIEVKIIDESRKAVGGVVEDWEKIDGFESFLVSRDLPILRGYVAALVCDVEIREAELSVRELCERLALDPSTVARGPITQALKGGWGWLFICAKWTNGRNVARPAR